MTCFPTNLCPAAEWLGLNYDIGQSVLDCNFRSVWENYETSEFKSSQLTVEHRAGLHVFYLRLNGTKQYVIAEQKDEKKLYNTGCQDILDDFGNYIFLEYWHPHNGQGAEKI